MRALPVSKLVAESVAGDTASKLRSFNALEHAYRVNRVVHPTLTYLYRGVISEKQIVLDDGKFVTFKYVCSDTGRWKTRRLEGYAFLRLLFRHVLPKGFRRARDYGFLHGNAKTKLQRIQLILRVVIKPVVEIKRADFLCHRCNHPMVITAFVKAIGEYG